MVFYYALRLTPHPNTVENVSSCRAKVPQFMLSIEAIDYVCGQEFEKNHHFHIVFSHSDEFDPQSKHSQQVDDIKESLYSIFDIPKDKRGNPSYSMEVVRDLEKALSYALKEGDYIYSDDWEQVAADSYENSHTKTHSLKSSIIDLSDKFIRDEINEKQLWVCLGQTRADLGIPLSLRWIDEMLLSIQCKKDPNMLSDLWEQRIIKS